MYKSHYNVACPSTKHTFMPRDIVVSLFPNGSGIYGKLYDEPPNTLLGVLHDFSMVLAASKPSEYDDDTVLVIHDGIIGYSFCRSVVLAK